MPAIRIFAAAVGAVAALAVLALAVEDVELTECRAERAAAERQRDLANLERMQERERSDVAVRALEVCGR